MKFGLYRWLGILCTGFFAGLVLSACTTYSVRTTDFTPANVAVVEVPEDYLLDVGIEVFDPELESIPDEALRFRGIRDAESVWVAENIRRTLQDTGAWGVVRIIPDARVIIDLHIQGRILQSDGEVLRLRVTARDSTGSVWLDKTYEQRISHYAYARELASLEPFQGLYNQISNDLLAHLDSLEADQRLALRRVTSMLFARDFSPEAFDGYLVENRAGRLQLDRLPARDDPMLARVERIRARDQMFVDILQDYYREFTDRMAEPYNVWLEQSYRETIVIRELENSARARRLGGWLALLGGVAAQFDDSMLTRLTGQVAIYAGLQSIRTGYTLQDEAALHIQSLTELGDSLQTELEPSRIELQDRTITLAGTVRDQYEQWQGILRDIYYQEIGYPDPP